MSLSLFFRVGTNWTWSRASSYCRCAAPESALQEATADGFYSSGAYQEGNCYDPLANFSPYNASFQICSCPLPSQRDLSCWGTTAESLPHGICLWKKTFFLFTIFHFQCPTSITLQVTIRSGRYHSSVTLLYFQHALVTVVVYPSQQLSTTQPLPHFPPKLQVQWGGESGKKVKLVG